MNPNVQAFLQRPKGIFVAGEWREVPESFSTFNPATGERLAEVGQAGEAEVDAAVRAARAAFPAWAAMLPAQRARLIYRLADAIEANAAELAEIEVLDNGKPLKEAARGDLPLAAEHFRYYAGWPTKICGKTVPVSITGVLNYTLREPVGVVGAIIPWNFPLLMAAWKLAPALAAGCTVVLKPAEQTPLSALRLAELAAEAGIPAGVINVVTGDGRTGAALVAHEDVNKVTFTGSTEVGRMVMRSAADRVKRVTLELGGKSANIVFEDADLEKAVRGAVAGVFYNQGQMCIAGSRVLVQESILEDFLAAFRKRAEGIKLGNGMSPETQMGPLVSEEQRERVLGFVRDGLAGGGSVVTGGVEAKGDGLEGGFFVPPTIFLAEDRKHRIVQEEVFGPVAAVIPFKDEADAVQVANDTRYGLAGGLWTQNLARAVRVAGQIRAGTVWVNSFNYFDPASPYGGYGESGFGREMGEEALDLYTEVKSVWLPSR
ncbi:MAG TPA: aldehyde dehydrogenase family protein [Deinococcales bacterium]|nr:aldehyde dehydrogenase family protein [Deinococcales bacterium]